MNCIFNDLKRGSRCLRCGWALPLDVKSKMFRQCDKEDSKPCVHLGEEVRSIPVKVCNGKPIGRAVCRCDIHGECFPLQPGSQGILYCPCNDYEA